MSESSQRVSISRSCSRKPSAMPRSFSSASAFLYTIGVSERFALVITRQSRSSPRSRTCSGVYGSMTPMELFSLRCMYVPRARFLSSTMGLRKDVSARSSASVTSQSRLAAAASRHITAKGFSSLCFRLRSRATA